MLELLHNYNFDGKTFEKEAIEVSASHPRSDRPIEDSRGIFIDRFNLGLVYHFLDARTQL